MRRWPVVRSLILKELHGVMKMTAIGVERSHPSCLPGPNVQPAPWLEALNLGHGLETPRCHSTRYTGFLAAANSTITVQADQDDVAGGGGLRAP